MQFLSSGHMMSKLLRAAYPEILNLDFFQLWQFTPTQAPHSLEVLVGAEGLGS